VAMKNLQVILEMDCVGGLCAGLEEKQHWWRGIGS
jgi:hypothetical protein